MPTTKDAPLNTVGKMKAEREAILATAKVTTTDARLSGRALTAVEQKSLNDSFARVDEIDDFLKRAKKGDEMWARLGRASAEPEGASLKTAGYMWAKSVTDRLRESAEGHGVKALLTGEVNTPPAVSVVPLPDTPTRLLDLIPREDLEAATWSYLRQTVRTNNAAAVADNATKPTSVYTFDEIQERARVIAHLSEPFPVRFADDYSSMTEVLNSQLVTGIWEAIEEMIVSGDSTTVGADEWDGILNTTGITEVAFLTDLPTTLRRARTVLEGKGERVTAVVMNPTDAETLDMLREDGTTGGFLLDGSAYERIFGPGAVGVPSLAVPAGSALVGDWSTTRLRIRQNAHTLAATQSGDLFDKNQMKLRTEGRFGFEVRRPQALALVALEADAG